jgi:predicted MFS family arabinose efflux permease
MLMAGVMSCLGAFSSEKVLYRFGHRAKYFASVLMGISIIVLSRHNLIVSIIAFAVASFANAVLFPIQSQSINELIPSKQRATIISVDSMIFSIMMIILFPLCGAVADYSNLHLVFMSLGILQLLIMLIINIKEKG